MYLNRGNFIKAEDVRKAYGLDRQEEALAAVFEVFCFQLRKNSLLGTT